jgi:hypothetical protein
VLFIGFALFYVIVSMPTPIDGSYDSAGVIFGNPRRRVNWLAASALHRAAKGPKNVPTGFLKTPAVFESIFDGIADVFVLVTCQLIALHSTR